MGKKVQHGYIEDQGQVDALEEFAPRIREILRNFRCIETFRIQFNKWPTRVRLDPGFIRELQEVMSDEDYGKLEGKIEIVSDDSNPYDGLYIAEDDEGNSFSQTYRCTG